MGRNHQEHEHSATCSHGDSHGHHHHHSHGHHHHHHHGAAGRMGFALFLNLGFAIIELIGGFLFNSVAILSDALHDFGDSLALLLALILEKISQKGSDEKYSYGYRRFSVLGALVTGIILMLGSAWIIVEAVPRLFHPETPNTTGMLFMAVLGVAVNGWAAWKVSKGESLNEKMLMWHMIEDLMGWVLVLIGAIVMKFFGLPQIDAALAIVLALWILFNVFRNLKETLKVFLMASPSPAMMPEIERRILAVPGVQAGHHFHLWSLDGEKHIFTGHVVLDNQSLQASSSNENQTLVDLADRVRKEIKASLRNMGIVEATLEIETTSSHCEDPEHKDH